MSVTLLQLKNRARQRADMENSEFVTDDELTDYINSSLAELYDLLVGAFGDDYFLADPHTITTVAGTTDYELPADFYKLRGVDVNCGSNWATVKPFNFNERNRSADDSWATMKIRYRLMGSNIKFTPVPTGGDSVRLWYVPTAPTLTTDSDSFDDVNKFSEYVVVDAAIKMLQKEESDVTVLMAQKDRLKFRLEQMANNRDAGSSETITDVHSETGQFSYE